LFDILFLGAIENRDGSGTIEADEFIAFIPYTNNLGVSDPSKGLPIWGDRLVSRFRALGLWSIYTPSHGRRTSVGGHQPAGRDQRRPELWDCH